MDTPGPEWRALVLASKDPRGEAETQELARLLREPGFRTGEFVEEAMRQRLLYRVSAILDETECGGALPSIVCGHLREGRRYNQGRMLALREAARQVGQLLQERGIDFAFTKGIVLESSVYRGEGTRRMNDVDLMISPASREATRQALLDAGYSTGTYDRKAGRLRPLPRETQLTYLLYPDHLPHFSRVVPDSFHPLLTFDVANSLTWQASEWQIPVEAALAAKERFEIGGTPLPRLSWSYSFLFLVLHFFREAWFVEHMERGDDVTLAKAADIYLSWKYHRDEILAGGLRELVASHSLQRPMAWVLSHIDRTLGSTIAAELRLQEHADEAWLSTVQVGPGERAVCLGSMDERLRSRDRRSLIRAAGPGA